VKANTCRNSEGNISPNGKRTEWECEDINRGMRENARILNSKNLL